MFAVSILAEKCNEFNIPMWAATLDFKRAFDSISHASIWESMLAHRVPPVYVDLLSRLYQDQRATIQCDCKSREFYIRKGTKQGDPISPIIFNCVLDEVLRTVKRKWSLKKFGMQLGHTDLRTMTNLRFADDILLIGRTLPQIKQMIADIAVEGAKVGLELHPDKTKILHNNIGYGSRCTKAHIQGMDIEILSPSSSTMYLGRALSLTNTHDTELEHRVRRAWAKFGTMKQELTDKNVPIGLRLKLFHATVTPTILYGAGSWVMTDAREATLRTTQLKMLRAMLGKKRLMTDGGETETWVDWVKRVTADARQLMELHKITDWNVEVRDRICKWATRVKNMDNDRWAKVALGWQPDGLRSRGRPRIRWTDQLEEWGRGCHAHP